MNNMWLVIIGIVVVVILILLFKILRTPKTTVDGHVIEFAKVKKKKQNQKMQKCTYCKKMDKLIFYASEEGTVVGVCKECKSKAIARDMLPL